MKYQQFKYAQYYANFMLLFSPNAYSFLGIPDFLLHSSNHYVFGWLITFLN